MCLVLHGLGARALCGETVTAAEFKAIEALLRDDVNDTTNGIRSVDGRSASLRTSIRSIIARGMELRSTAWPALNADEVTRWPSTEDNAGQIPQRGVGFSGSGLVASAEDHVVIYGPQSIPIPVSSGTSFSA